MSSPRFGCSSPQPQLLRVEHAQCPLCSALFVTVTLVRFQIGDGGDGGGVALMGVEWGKRALAAAEEVLGEHFGDDVAMFAFKVSPKGYVYVRLDKLTNR